MTKRHYVLLATDGYTDLPTSPDLNDDTRKPLYIWGFIGGLLSVDDVAIPENSYLDWRKSYNWDNIFKLKGSAELPSPIIWGEVNDDIYITLINLGMLHRTDMLNNHSIHLHGANVATQLDGFSETSFGVPVWLPNSKYNCLCSPPTITYYFKPNLPGTLLYNCHVDAHEHIQMGMYGSLIIYPSFESLSIEGIHKESDGSWYFNNKQLDFIPKTATNRNFAYNNPYSYYDKEYIMLLSDIDTKWHNSVLNGEDFNSINFKPDYWLINGRSFPDTLLPHNQLSEEICSKDLTQINYNSYVHVNANEKILLRMINTGYDDVPWHTHGWHFEILGKDCSLSPFLSLKTLVSIENHSKISDNNFTLNIASGETYDLLIKSNDKSSIYENYVVNGQDHIQPLCAQIIKLYSENSNCIYDIPTEPVNIKDMSTLNYFEVCSRIDPKSNTYFYPQFYPMYNHALYKLTNNGIYPGGQLTYIQADSPSPELSNVELENINSNMYTTPSRYENKRDYLKPLDDALKSSDTNEELIDILINNDTSNYESHQKNIAELQIEPVISEYYLDENNSISDMLNEIKELKINDVKTFTDSNSIENKSLFEMLDEIS